MKLVLLYAGAALLIAFVKGIKRNGKDEGKTRWGHLRVGSEVTTFTENRQTKWQSTENPSGGWQD